MRDPDASLRSADERMVSTAGLPDRLYRMNESISEFLRNARRELIDVTNLPGLRDPLGALIGLAQAAPEAPRTRALAIVAKGIVDGHGTVPVDIVDALDLRALVVLCRLEDEHLAGRYTGEEWGEALKVLGVLGA